MRVEKERVQECQLRKRELISASRKKERVEKECE